MMKSSKKWKMSKLNIFIINLKRIKERRDLMQKQFEGMSDELKERFSVSFFDAIDAQNGEHLAFKQYDKALSFLFRGKGLSDGERACYASHYRLWEECVRLNRPIIILEDDLSILPNFWESLQSVAQSEYAYVRLMFLEHKIKAIKLPDDFYTSLDKVTGTQGYYLTPLGARAFIDSAQTWYCPIDDYMGMFYIHKIPSVCVKPIIYEIEIDTSIKGRWSKIRWYFKIIRETSRLLFQCKRAVFLLFGKKHLIMPKYALDALGNRQYVMLERTRYSTKA